MATVLKKDLVRETTELVDGKEIIVTLTVDQEIELKVKGTRGSGETIGIKELYEQLYAVRSLTGQLIQSGACEKNVLFAQPSGIYLITVHNGSQSFTKKVYVQ